MGDARRIGACGCGRCGAITRQLRLLPEEAWPWRTMGALLALIGLLLLSGTTAALVPLGATVAAVPRVRARLGSCPP